MAIPKGLDPTGVILVDKPAGPSSFGVLAGVRARTRAKTGHAGTLDPFATGLLLLLSGRATRLASCFVGLPKRYLTDIDLSHRTTTGDPEGDPLDVHEPPSCAELEAALAALRGDVELPIPTASAVKIGGERAYRLHRKGIAVEMPMRRSRIDALDVIAYTDGIATLDVAVSSGTYVRSIADVLGGHCAALRRTEVGPFSIAEADAERMMPIEEALARVGLTLAEADADRRNRADSDRQKAAEQAALAGAELEAEIGADTVSSRGVDLSDPTGEAVVP
jgi:tRNA pseudouridine55 synthase